MAPPLPQPPVAAASSSSSSSDVIITRRSSSRLQMKMSASSSTAAAAANNNNKKRWSDLSPYWRRQYLDLGHCRLRKCAHRIRTATPEQLEELQEMDSSSGLLGGIQSLMAMAISAASAYGASKEAELVQYTQTVIDCCSLLDPNDRYNSNSAVVLAAYHGYPKLLKLLLQTGCCIVDNTNNKQPVGSYGNALMASLRNGQHASLGIILRERPLYCRQLLQDPAATLLSKAILRGDAISLDLLRQGGALLSSKDCQALRQNFRPLVALMQSIPAAYQNNNRNRNCGASWSLDMHWSFPPQDRSVVDMFLERDNNNKGNSKVTATNPSDTTTTLQANMNVDPCILPQEVRLRILNYISRGWFSS